MKYKPLYDRLVIKRLEEEEKTKGGIIIPDAAKEKPQEGRVIAVGDGKMPRKWPEITAIGKSGGQDFVWQIFRNGDQN